MDFRIGKIISIGLLEKEKGKKCVLRAKSVIEILKQRSAEA